MRRTEVLDILLFAGVLLMANGLWKLTCEPLITDTTTPFQQIIYLLCQEIYGVLHFFIPTLQLHNTTLTFSDTPFGGLSIVASCTAVKQFVLFTCVVAVTRRVSWKRKGVFLLLSIGIIHLLNFSRLTTITAITYLHPEQFHLFHDYIFKYLFYILLFIWWLIWYERFSKRVPPISILQR